MRHTSDVERFPIVARPANRSGRPDRFFHFIVGYLAPTLTALADSEVDGPVGVMSVGSLDRLWADCRHPEIRVIPEAEFDAVAAQAPVRLAARGYDSPHAHVLAPWPAVRRAVMHAYGVDPKDAGGSDARKGSPRILVVERRPGEAPADGAVGAGSGSDRRSIPNLADLAAALGSAGEVRVEAMEGLTLPEQMRIFRWADVVVAQHGAALANLIWTRKGTRLVEIVTPDKANVLPGYYEALGLEVAHVTQDDGHAVVDVDAVLDGVTRRIDAPEHTGRIEKRGARTPIPWSARAWKRHEDRGIDERDSARWAEQLTRWPRVDASPADAASTPDAPILALASAWRSGSTLLQRLLMSGGDTLVWGEPYAQRDPIGQLTDMYVPFRDGYPVPQHFLPERQSNDAFALSESWVANLYPGVDDLQRAHRAMLTELLATPAHAAGFARWGLKEVRLDATQAEYVAGLFPGTRIVFLVRNPYDAFRSYRSRGGWYERFPDRPVFDAETFARHWRRLTRSFLGNAERMGALLVSFEDMTSDPATLQRIADHTGVAIDPAVLDIHARGKETSKEASKDTGEVSPIRPKEMRVLAEVWGDLPASLGYATPEG